MGNSFKISDSEKGFLFFRIEDKKIVANFGAYGYGWDSDLSKEKVNKLIKWLKDHKEK